MPFDFTQVDSIIGKHGARRGSLISVLIDIQGAFSHIPPDALKRVAQKLELPVMQVYQVARFYKAFNFKPRNRHTISVCAGTACYTRSGGPILAEIRRLLRIAPGEATADGEFTLETVNCPGNCPAGPLMILDGVCHGRVTPEQVESVLRPYLKGREAAPDGQA